MNKGQISFVFKFVQVYKKRNIKYSTKEYYKRVDVEIKAFEFFKKN